MDEEPDLWSDEEVLGELPGEQEPVDKQQEGPVGEQQQELMGEQQEEEPIEEQQPEPLDVQQQNQQELQATQEQQESLNTKKDDVGFVLFCAFIFEKRTRPGSPSLDTSLAETSAWLIKNNKLNLNVEPCAPATLDFDDADTPRVVDLLNTYAPEFPINLQFSDNSRSYAARRIQLKSPATYSYTIHSGILDLPFLHGGMIEVVGDVSFDTVVDLLSSNQSLAFTTRIHVSGELAGCDVDSVQLAIRHLRQCILEKRDDDLFEFSVCGRAPALDVEPVVVRKWRLSYSRTDDSRACLRAVKVF